MVAASCNLFMCPVCNCVVQPALSTVRAVRLICCMQAQAHQTFASSHSWAAESCQCTKKHLDSTATEPQQHIITSSALFCFQTHTYTFTHWHFWHTLPNSVSPDGWKCVRWWFSPATGVVRHHLSAAPVMEEKGRNTISPYLTFLHSPRFHSPFSCLWVPTRRALPVFSSNRISLFHTFICVFLSAVNFILSTSVTLYCKPAYLAESQCSWAFFTPHTVSSVILLLK